MSFTPKRAPRDDRHLAITLTPLPQPGRYDGCILALVLILGLATLVAVYAMGAS